MQDMDGPIVVFVVNKAERSAGSEVFGVDLDGTPDKGSGKSPYFRLPEMSDTFVAISEMGSGTSGGSQQLCKDLILKLRPKLVIACGIAFGLDSAELDDDGVQLFGDVLVSTHLCTYEAATVGQGGKVTIERGYRIPASRGLVAAVRGALAGFGGAKVYYGDMVSGEKLVKSTEFRSNLKERFPRAIGGDMEGSGLLVEAQDAKIDCLVVKGVSDWGTEDKDDESQMKAARNAALAVRAILMSRALQDHYDAAGKHPRKDLSPLLRLSLKKPQAASPWPSDLWVVLDNASDVGLDIELSADWVLNHEVGQFFDKDTDPKYTGLRPSALEGTILPRERLQGVIRAPGWAGADGHFSLTYRSSGYPRAVSWAIKSANGWVALERVGQDVLS